MQSELQLVKQQLLTLLADSNDASLNYLAGKLQLSNNDNWMESLAMLHVPESKPLVDRFRCLDASLCQIQLGLYGVCSDCEDPIELERLADDPTTQRCAKCEAAFTKRPKQTRVWL